MGTRLKCNVQNVSKRLFSVWNCENTENIQFKILLHSSKQRRQFFEKKFIEIWPVGLQSFTRSMYFERMSTSVSAKGIAMLPAHPTVSGARQPRLPFRALWDLPRESLGFHRKTQVRWATWVLDEDRASLEKDPSSVHFERCDLTTMHLTYRHIISLFIPLFDTKLKLNIWETIMVSGLEQIEII